MRCRIGWGTGVLAVVLVIENAWLLWPMASARVLRIEEGPAARGRRVAAELGCFNCHGPEGLGGVPNPGSRRDAVPGFGEKTLMMFVKNDAELREYVLDGAPARRRSDAKYQAEMEAQALRMPAYRDFVSDDDASAIVAFLRASSGMLAPPEGPVARGEALARRAGCFNCHGVMGSGGHANPGSFKGYIPGFLGDDFSDLVRHDGELTQWIRNGVSDRFAGNPLARRFLDRQRVRMPAYGKFLADDEIDDVVAYVRWLAGGAWGDTPLVR